MTFDPETAYAGDWQYLDFVDEAVLEKPGPEGVEKITGVHVRRGNIDTSEFIGLTTGLALSTEATAFAVWPPVASDSDEVTDLALFQGCILRIDGEGWMVLSFEKTRFGRWHLIADKELVNAAT